MSTNNAYVNLREYEEYFQNLQAAAYKDVVLNGTCLRILGAHFMDFGCDWRVKKHRHSFFEFHYVTEGDVYTTINNREYHVKPGNFYIMPPGTYHSHRQGPGTFHHGFALRWDLIQVDKLSNNFNITFDFDRVYKALRKAHSRPVKDDGTILNGMLKLLNTGKGGFGLLELQLAFCQLSIGISRFYETESEDLAEHINYSYLEDRTIESAMDFIEENVNEDIDVNDIASSVHLSYSHLSRLFKKHMGETITHYLNRMRVEKAQRLLVCTDKSMACIAEEVGFNNVNYFCTVFKKFYDVTPGRYRENKNNLSE